MAFASRRHVSALIVFAAIACSDSLSTSLHNSALDHTVTSAHYVFHMTPGDIVDTTWQEAYCTWVVTQLAVQPTGRLDYFKYRDRAHMQQITGRLTNGFAEPGTTRFHTIWPVDNHEGVRAFDDAATRTESRFLAAYAKSIDAAWSEWRAWLRS